MVVSMKIDVFLDDEPTPFETIIPPNKFTFNTSNVPDGEHKLRFVAIDGQGITSERTVTFAVQNGPAIVLHGIDTGDTVQGEISILTNAYTAKVGDEFEPVRIETPAPIPTWAWVLFLCVIGWGVGYVSLELHDRNAIPLIMEPSDSLSKSSAESQSAGGQNELDSDWRTLGKQVYGNNCSSCHQGNGAGLSGVFPPLKGNSVVGDPDATQHIVAILYGVTGKKIDGIEYVSPMPPFSGSLTDDEIAAVVNHERTQWDNNAPTVTAETVANLRK